MHKHIRSPYTHDPLCGAKSRLAMMNRGDVETIYCDLVMGKGEFPCLECVRQLAYALSDRRIGAKEKTDAA